MLIVGRHPTASIAPRFVKTVTLPLLYGLAPPGSGHFCRAGRCGQVGNRPPIAFFHAEFTSAYWRMG